MHQRQFELHIKTAGKGLTDITATVKNWIREIDATTGQLTLFCKHTSCSLTIQENADPDVLEDLVKHFEKAVPENEPWYKHTCEGPDDMPAHIKTALTDVSLAIPVCKGQLTLGMWQGIYLFEHRTSAHSRKILLHYIGE